MVVPWLASAHGQGTVSGEFLSVVQLPVDVDHRGTVKVFETARSDTSMTEDARSFCDTHVREWNLEECMARITLRVKILRQMKLVSMLEIPGLSFMMYDSAGKPIRFIHRPGSNPTEEFRFFCLDHFFYMPEVLCIDEMYDRLARALDITEATKGNIYDSTVRKYYHPNEIDS